MIQLIPFYFLLGSWGSVKKGRDKFEKISAVGKRGVVPWNTMISAYVQNGCPFEV